jgi:hypothetical protein
MSVEPSPTVVQAASALQPEACGTRYADIV